MLGIDVPLLPDSFFRKLNEQEVEEFKAWARSNFHPGDKIQDTWHPVVRAECHKMEEEVQNAG